MYFTNSTAGIITRILFVCVCLLHLYIPFVNHYCFRTYAYDYGAYNFAFFDYAHFRISPCPVYSANLSISFFQDHYSFSLILLSPLYYLFTPVLGSYTLLFIQWLFVCWGGWCCLRLVEFKLQNNWAGFMALCLYFFMQGRLCAYQADCNLVIMGSAAIPAFIYYFERGFYYRLLATFVFLITVREDYSLWMAFICLTLAIQHRKNKTPLIGASILSLVSFAYFILQFKVLIPLANTAEHSYSLFNYSRFGENPFQAFLCAIQHPLKIIKALFINHTGDAAANGLKMEFYLVYLISGACILLLRPVYLLALLPLLAKKMLNDDVTRWGYGSYYGAEAASIISVLIILTLSGFKSRKTALSLMALFGATSLAVSAYCYGRDLPVEFGAGKYGFVNPRFTESRYPSKAIHESFNLIPDTATVVASACILPHLAMREHIYYFPQTSNVTYVALFTNGDAFPASQAYFNFELAKLLQNPEWEIIYHRGDYYLLKKSPKPLRTPLEIRARFNEPA